MLSTRILSTVCAALLLAGSTAYVRADDKIDNPRYKAWASFKVGSTETIAGTMPLGVMQIGVEMKLTLTEVTADHVTVEVVTKTTVNGQDHVAPANVQTVNAKTDPKDVKELDPEDVSAMGKTYKCKVMQVVNDLSKQNAGQSGTADMKVWGNQDIPGGIVKLEMQIQTPRIPAPVTVTYLLKDFESK